MKFIRLRNSTYQTLVSRCGKLLKPFATQTSKGDWLVPIYDYSWYDIERRRMVEETVDEFITRLIHIKGGEKVEYDIEIREAIL